MRIIKVDQYYVASQGYIVCCHKDRMTAIRMFLSELIKATGSKK